MILIQEKNIIYIYKWLLKYKNAKELEVKDWEEKYARQVLS